MHDSEAGEHFTPILHEWNECDIGALAHAVQNVMYYIYRENTHDKQKNHNFAGYRERERERCDKARDKLIKNTHKKTTATLLQLLHTRESSSDTFKQWNEEKDRERYERGRLEFQEILINKT